MKYAPPKKYYPIDQSTSTKEKLDRILDSLDYGNFDVSGRINADFESTKIITT